MNNTNNPSLPEILEDFVDGLLKKAKVTHAGNCLTMCQILQPYLSVVCGVETNIKNCKVKQGRKSINHYYLEFNEWIIDATASQFNTPDGEIMPKIYIGQKPNYYDTKIL